MRPRLLTEGGGVGADVVLEVVEVEACAAGHPPLHVRAAEADVSEPGIGGEVVPRADSGEQPIHRHPAGHALALRRGEGAADDAIT